MWSECFGRLPFLLHGYGYEETNSDNTTNYMHNTLVLWPVPIVQHKCHEMLEIHMEYGYDYNNIVHRPAHILFAQSIYSEFYVLNFWVFRFYKVEQRYEYNIGL